MTNAADNGNGEKDFQWFGETEKAYFDRMGIRMPKNKLLLENSDVEGLEKFVQKYADESGKPLDNGKTTNYAAEFKDWKYLIDSSRIIEEFPRPTPKQKRDALTMAPGFWVGTELRTGEQYVRVGNGGTFFNRPEPGDPAYKDNNGMDPVAYRGTAIVFEEPIKLGDLNIRGLVGLDMKVSTYEKPLKADNIKFIKA